MSKRTREQRLLPEMPFHVDLLDGDLDDRYPGIRKPIHWGMVVGAVGNAWSETVQVPGFDWILRLCIPGDLKLPTFRTPTRRQAWRGVRQHCALAVALVDADTPNRARDAGRPTVRALLAVLRRHYKHLVLSDTIWEGPVTGRPGKIGFGASELTLEAREPRPPSELSAIGLKLAPMKMLALPSHVTRTLQWMQLARAAPVRVDSFAHLWFALIALVRFGQPPRGDDMRRIHSYLDQFRSGTGGHPIYSVSRVDALETLFEAAYDARNALFHRDDDSLITDDLIGRLEDGLFQLTDSEVRRVRAS